MQFPSMRSLHTTQPNAVAPTGAAHASNFGTAPPSCMQPQLSNMAPAFHGGCAVPTGISWKPFVYVFCFHCMQ